MTSRRTVLGSAASIGLLRAAGHAVGQPPVKLFRIGYLSLRAGPNSWDEAFVQRLRELGYRTGDNLLIEYRWADEDLSLLERQAVELVRLPVDVIVTAQVPAVRIAQKATAAIPIVMAAGRDPVGSGFIADLAKPGGNITGLTNDPSQDVHGKRLELLKEAVPRASRVAFLWNPVPPGAHVYRSALESAARKLGVTVQVVEVRAREDVGDAHRGPRTAADDARCGRATAVAGDPRSGGDRAPHRRCGGRR